MKDHFIRWVNLTIVLVGLSVSAPAQDQSKQDESKQNALDAAVVSEQEKVRRQEALIDAQMLMKQAENEVSMRNFSKGLGYYQEAEKKLTKAPASEEFVTQIQRGESLCLYQLAAEAFDKKDFSQAIEQSAQAYQLDPGNKDALDLHESALGADKQYQARKQRGVVEAAAAPEISNEDFKNKQKRVLDLYRSYENYFKSEQYDQAEQALKEILRLDPYSATAYHRLREVQLAKYRKLYPGQQESETEILTEAQKAWILPNRRDVIPGGGIQGPTGPVQLGDTSKILKKLNSIVINKIEFDNTPIREAVNRLIDLSREADEPTHEGVNILLSLGKEAGAAASAPAPEAAAPAPGGFGAPGEAGAPPAAPPAAEAPAPAEAGPASFGGIPVSLNLRNVNLLNVVKFLTKVTQLQYQIEPEAVVISTEAIGSAGHMQTRIFNMAPGVFMETFARTEGAAAGGGGGGGFVRMVATPTKTNKVDVKKIFEDFGIVFPAGASISYNEVLGILVATNTPDNLDQIEAIVLKLNKTPPQVTIEAKFMDIKQTDLEDLSFEWAFAQATQKNYVIESGRGTSLPGLPIGHAFGGATPTYLGLGNPLTGGIRNSTSIQGDAIDTLLSGAATVNPTIATITAFLTDPQAQLYIDALSQKGITDLLQAPKVTTTSGESAKIMVTREFIYPSTYSEPTVVAGTASAGGGTGSVGVVAPSPTAFSTREVGVILDVKPQVGPDGFTIAMTLSPEVVDFEGFVNYYTYAAANTASFTFPLQQPIFNKRTITTSVTIWDGQTIVMGGLINNTTTKINDKVPFLGDLPVLGRLFQSKVDETSKHSLVIFLNARVVDPSGKPVHNFEQVSLASSPAATAAQ